MRRHPMKRKGLYFLIALALGGVGAVHAQDAGTAPADASSSAAATPSYDGRWYIAPTIVGGVSGHSKRIWSTNSAGVAGRFYAGDWNAWRPCALVGIMRSHHQS